MNRTRRSISALGAVVAISVLAWPVFAADESGYTQEQGRQNGMTWQKTTITATVVEIMADSGMVALEGPQGNIRTVVVDEKVDLSNLTKGDKVEVVYYEAQGVEFREPTAADRRQPLVVEDEVEAPKGTNPKAGALREIKALVQVTSVDKANNTITVQGPLGRSFVLDIADPATFDRVREGDEWVVVYQEGVVVSLKKK